MLDQLEFGSMLRPSNQWSRGLCRPGVAVKGLIADLPKRTLTQADMDAAGIGGRYWGCTLGAVPEAASYRAALAAYCGNLRDNIEQGRGLLFKGQFGRGKTGAAVSILKRAIVHGASGLMVRANFLPEAYMNPRPLYSAGQTFAERIETVDLLVLDDLGAGHQSGWSTSWVEEVIRSRHDRLLATIATTNLDAQDLLKNLGKSCLSVVNVSMPEVLCDGYRWRDAGAAGNPTT